MRIISQTRDTSIEFDGTEIFLQYESVIYQSEISKGKLGKYATCKRAKEVFLEIHKQWLEDCMSIYKMPEE